MKLLLVVLIASLSLLSLCSCLDDDYQGPGYVIMAIASGAARARGAYLPLQPCTRALPSLQIFYDHLLLLLYIFHLFSGDNVGETEQESVGRVNEDDHDSTLDEEALVGGKAARRKLVDMPKEEAQKEIR